MIAAVSVIALLAAGLVKAQTPACVNVLESLFFVTVAYQFCLQIHW